ncbi:unnamed protein product, partial [marine sediment metagenome]
MVLKTKTTGFKKYNNILIFFLIFGLLVNMFFVNNNMVVTASTSETTGFEDDTLTEEYSNSWVTTNGNGNANTYVSDVNPYSGSKSYKFQGDNYVFFNFTVSDIIVNASWWFYYPGTGSFPDDHYFGFSNSTAGVFPGNIHFKIEDQQEDNELFFLSETQSWTLMTTLVPNVWYHMGFQYNAIDNVTY